jgi:hypothetical protein
LTGNGSSPARSSMSLSSAEGGCMSRDDVRFAESGRGVHVRVCLVFRKKADNRNLVRDILCSHVSGLASDRDAIRSAREPHCLRSRPSAFDPPHVKLAAEIGAHAHRHNDAPLSSSGMRLVCIPPPPPLYFWPVPPCRLPPAALPLPPIMLVQEMPPGASRLGEAGPPAWAMPGKIFGKTTML